MKMLIGILIGIMVAMAIGFLIKISNQDKTYHRSLVLVFSPYRTDKEFKFTGLDKRTISELVRISNIQESYHEVVIDNGIITSVRPSTKMEIVKDLPSTIIMYGKIMK